MFNWVKILNTWRMKEEKLQCLKKVGNSSDENLSSSTISKELPSLDQRTMDQFYS